MKKDVRTRILNILVEPTTVTGLKIKLKDIESFGTIAYHLDKLKKEGIVDKKKDESKRGCPTTYFLIDKDLLKFVKERRSNYIIGKKEVLKVVKEKEFIEELELCSIIERSDIPEDSIEYIIEEISGCSCDKLITIHYKITPKGLKFLEEQL